MADAEDLEATATAGYKVGEKKTIQELATLDNNDESLKKWKESLGLAAGVGATSGGDPRKVVVVSLSLEVEGRPDVEIMLDTEENLAKLKDKNNIITIKEGVTYRLKVKFKVQHDVISGLKYLHSVKKLGIRVDKMEEMVGSYGPNAEPYTKKFPTEESPSGMLARGTFQVKSRFIDDDKVCHLEWDWQFAIKKDW